MQKMIEIRGARVHNLKNLDIDLPRYKLIVVTGVSGSGKSSFAFDTLYAEGQRRYVESLSSYARQFLERMERPDVDEIRGISPAVAIEQKNVTRSSRSTVATATEIHDYLRLLYARIGRTFCSECGQEVRKDSIEDSITRILDLPADTKIQITFPLSGHNEDEKHLQLSDLVARGFNRLLIDGELVQASDLKDIGGLDTDSVLVLVDRLKVQADEKTRLADSLDMAFNEGHGRIHVSVEGGEPLLFSQRFECIGCDKPYIAPQPRLFSFNNPYGACPTCKGFGEIIELDLGLVIPDESKSLFEGAIVPWNTPKHRHMRSRLQDLCIENEIDMGIPWRDLPDEHRKLIIDGTTGFPGIRKFFKRLEHKKYKIGVRVFLSRYRGFVTCPDCDNTRLRQEALLVRINGKDIGEVGKLTFAEAESFFNALQLTDFENEIAHQILKELHARLTYLVDVGLGYLTLDRRTQTLSGGEYQRINLATAVGFKLTGSLYILDEPSIGLHPRDNERLIKILLALRDLGNTVVVVEHDRDMMEVSDHLIDLGPFAGENGGQLVYEGGIRDVINNGISTLTAAYLKGEKEVSAPAQLRKGSGTYLLVKNAREHNLKSIDVNIPLGKLVAVTGVSGSGKSTLVHDVIYAGLAKKFDKWQKHVGRHDDITGVENIDDVVLVDQSPIGRTPRSNPATYTKAYDGIRKLFAQTRQAQLHGLTAGSFSFNTVGGRCERCGGAGQETVEMQFLADVQLTCEQCDGRRFRQEVLEIRYNGKNISEVLDMQVSEAVAFFEGKRNITNRLKLLDEVGLGYLRLGQSSVTLSGGEAQRVKLASHLAEKSNKRILYIFDEPTTGLHFYDIAVLMKCLDKIIDRGNSILIVEHNLDVIKCADHIIDLGPEGGDRGGEIIATGSPADLAENTESHTGIYLKKYLQS